MVAMTDPTLVILAAGRARRYGGVKQLAPVGIHGEAVIDLIASDAYLAGFGHIVVVVNPDTGPLIREHIATSWPSDARVSFAVQETPIGTVHAVLSAQSELDATSAFGVANADDLYGHDAMMALGNHLRDVGSNCVVGFYLDRALVGDAPVTRGVCTVEDGMLVSITERRQVHKNPEGFVSDDGLEPRTLANDTRVSMNLWGFESSMWDEFQRAMTAAEASEDAEVLLPEIVGAGLASNTLKFAALTTSSYCVGVTHAQDLPLVQADVKFQVENNLRPERAFSKF